MTHRQLLHVRGRRGVHVVHRNARTRTAGHEPVIADGTAVKPDKQLSSRRGICPLPEGTDPTGSTHSDTPVWETMDTNPGLRKVAVNARLLEDFDLDAVPVEVVDGRNNW